MATPENKLLQCVRPCHPCARISASRTVFTAVGCSSPFSVRIAQHLTAPRAWCKQASNQSLPGRGKPYVLRPGIAGMRGSRVIGLRPCNVMSTPRPPSSFPALVLASLSVLQAGGAHNGYGVLGGSQQQFHRRNFPRSLPAAWEAFYFRYSSEFLSSFFFNERSITMHANQANFNLRNCPRSFPAAWESVFVPFFFQVVSCISCF